MSPLYPPAPALDRRRRPRSGMLMSSPVSPAPANPRGLPTAIKEWPLYQADESTYLHGGQDWSTVVRSCRFRLGWVAILFVGISQGDDLVRMVITGGH